MMPQRNLIAAPIIVNIMQGDPAHTGTQATGVFLFAQVKDNVSNLRFFDLIHNAQGGNIPQWHCNPALLLQIWGSASQP